MDFKVGDRVICVETYENDYGDNLVKGEYYTILDIQMCNCGTVGIYVGLVRLIGQIVCLKCDFTFEEGRLYNREKRFTKIESLDTDADISAFMDIFNEKTEKV